jgi:hypothetical protein
MGAAGVRMGKMEKKITVRNSLDTTERTVRLPETRHSDTSFESDTRQKK